MSIAAFVSGLPVNLPFRADEATQFAHQQGSEQSLLCRKHSATNFLYQYNLQRFLGEK